MHQSGGARERATAVAGKQTRAIAKPKLCKQIARMRTLTLGPGGPLGPCECVCVRARARAGERTFRTMDRVYRELVIERESARERQTSRGLARH